MGVFLLRTNGPAGATLLGVANALPDDSMRATSSRELAADVAAIDHADRAGIQTTDDVAPTFNDERGGIERQRLNAARTWRGVGISGDLQIFGEGGGITEPSLGIGEKRQQSKCSMLATDPLMIWFTTHRLARSRHQRAAARYGAHNQATPLPLAPSAIRVMNRMSGKTRYADSSTSGRRSPHRRGWRRQR